MANKPEQHQLTSSHSMAACAPVSRVRGRKMPAFIGLSATSWAWDTSPVLNTCVLCPSSHSSLLMSVRWPWFSVYWTLDVKLSASYNLNYIITALGFRFIWSKSKLFPCDALQDHWKLELGLTAANIPQAVTQGGTFSWTSGSFVPVAAVWAHQSALHACLSCPLSFWALQALLS